MEVEEKILDEFEDLSFLTERQQQVVELRRKGMSFEKIGKELGCSGSATRQHYAHAERRGRECKHYNAIEEKNKEIVAFPIARGELKLLLDAIRLLERKLEGNHRFADDDWKGKLPYEYDIVKGLEQRVHDSIYPPKPEEEKNNQKKGFISYAKHGNN